MLLTPPRRSAFVIWRGPSRMKSPLRHRADRSLASVPCAHASRRLKIRQLIAALNDVIAASTQHAAIDANRPWRREQKASIIANRKH